MSRVCRRIVSDERGMTLVLALTIMLVFSISTVSVIAYTLSNQTAASNASANQVAFNLAEAGLERAVAILQDPTSSGHLMDPTLLPTTPTSGSPSTWTVPDPYTTTWDYSEGTARAWGTLHTITAGNLSKGFWTVTATGTVRYAAGGRTQYLTHKVSADVAVDWQLSQNLNTDAWRYIYSWNTGSQCDESIYNNTSVTASLYVAGNLCLQNPASIEGSGSSSSPVDVYVKGYVDLEANSDIGKAKALNSVHIQNGCWYKFTTYSTGAGTPTNPVCGAPGGYDIYPTATMGSFTTVPPPVADFVGWYTFSSPGPLNDCDAAQSNPTPVNGVRPSAWPTFDNNGGLDNSLPTVVNITPQSSSYDCKTATGEIKWDAPTGPNPVGTLTINGTVYFDGSVTAGPTSGSMPIQYVGKGALYASGTFLLKNAVFCVSPYMQKQGNTYSCNGTGFGTASDPYILVVATNGVGSGGSDPQSQVASGDGIEIKSSSFQGALYATHTIQIDTSSSAQAPMVSGNEIISQTGGSPFPILATVPFGTPGNPATDYKAGQPQFFRDG